jgi:hypothetical protein
MKKDKKNTNSTVDNRERRRELHCDYCPPNRGENQKRKPKSDVHKTKRKGR